MVTGPGDEPRIWTIGDLNRRASRAVVMDFRGPVWIEGDLASIVERRGSRYLELVERGGGRDGRDAHLGAFCSATRWQRLAPKLAEAAVDLRAGQHLRLAGSLDIGDRGKLMLTIDDVDIAALVGERLQSRQRLVQRLVADDLFDANRRLDVPPLPLRIGLVASAGSDGHGDLVRQLEASGFAFHITLRSIQVEGPAAPRAVQAALATFGTADIDVAVIVRGGGARASLDVFDQPPVAHAIASAAVPVWTGIGHTGDRTVADDVAHRAFATPTAVGQALVAAVVAAWDDVTAALGRIAGLVDSRLAAASAELNGRWRAASTLARHQLELRRQVHSRASSDLCRAAVRHLDSCASHITTAAQLIGSSGGAELRDAQRRLGDLARATTGAARLRCADATDDLASTASAVSTRAGAALDDARQPIERAQARLPRARFDGIIDGQSAVARTAAGRVGREVRRRLDADSDRAASQRAVLEAYDPRRQLARGWTLTHTADGRLLRHAADVAEGVALVTTFADGEATSTVTRVTRTDQEDTA